MKTSESTTVLFRVGNTDGAQKTTCLFNVPPGRFEELRKAFRSLSVDERPTILEADRGGMPISFSDEWTQFLRWIEDQGVSCEQVAAVALVSYGQQPDMSAELAKAASHPADITICGSCSGSCEPV